MLGNLAQRHCYDRIINCHVIINSVVIDSFWWNISIQQISLGTALKVRFLLETIRWSINLFWCDFTVDKRWTWVKDGIIVYWTFGVQDGFLPLPEHVLHTLLLDGLWVWIIKSLAITVYCHCLYLVKVLTSNIDHVIIVGKIEVFITARFVQVSNWCAGKFSLAMHTQFHLIF